MSLIEQLRPFLSLCQASGFMPYSLECDLNTKKLLKFGFSWSNFITWWFIFLAVLQLGLPTITILFAGDVIEKLRVDAQAPITISMLMNVTVLCYVVQLVLSRWIPICDNIVD